MVAEAEKPMLRKPESPSRMLSVAVALPAEKVTSWLSLASGMFQSLPAGGSSVTVTACAAVVAPARVRV